MHVVALIVFSVAASAMQSIWLFDSSAFLGDSPLFIFPILLVAAGFAICGTLIGTARPLIPFIILSALVLFALGFTVLGALPSILVLSVALLSYLCRIKSPLWLLPIGTLSYLLAFAFVCEPITPIFSLTPAIAALVLHLSHKRGAQRVSAVVRISLVYGLLLVIPIVFLFVMIGVGLLYPAELETAESLKELLTAFVTNFRDGLISTLTTTLNETYAMIPELNIDPAKLYGAVSESVTLVFNYLPAITVIAIFMMAYLTHSLYVALIVPITSDAGEIKNALTFKVSIVCAVVYIATFLFSAALRYDGHDMYATALGNVYLLLAPALTMVAFGFAGAFLKGERPSCLGYLLYVSMFVMLFTRPEIVLPLASFVGAMVVIISAIVERRKEKDGADM